MTSRTKAEELAEDCITRFKPPRLSPRSNIYSEFIRVDELIKEYLEEVVTADVAIDIIMNFPEEYVDNFFENYPLEGIHPKTLIMQLAKDCIVSVIFSKIHQRT